MKNETVYLVSNIHRSGSSMMMRCLEGGGMSVAYDDSQEYLNDLAEVTGYVANPNGFYALSEDFEREDFGRIYQGKALKYPFRSLLKLPAGKYKILFLRREPEEIRASMEAFTPGCSWGQDSTILFFYDEVTGAVMDALRAREDVELITLNYADVVKDPVGAFEYMKSCGWPIEVESAAALVDSSLHRLKLEKK